MDLTIDSFKIAMNEVLEDNVHVEVAVTRAIEKYDKKLKQEVEKMCEQNVKIAIAEHKDFCEGSKVKFDKKPWFMIIPLAIDAIMKRTGN